MEWETIYFRLTHDRDDALAWGALERHVARWARAVFSGRDHQMVEDVVAETCASVATGMGAARRPETFAGFTYGHFLNVRRRVLRLERLRDRAESAYVVDRGGEPAEADPDPELLRQLRHALNELPNRQRRAVELRYFEQMPALRIAVELGVTEGNARRVVFNGIQHLRDKLR